MSAEIRSREQRKADTLALLTTPAIDVWVATTGNGDGAGDSKAHLVPLSLAWVGGRIVIAAADDSATVRNLRASGVARLGLGPTRDVVMIDAVLESTVDVSSPQATQVAEAYAGQADWDPRDAGPGYSYLVLAPVRIQAWRESNELPGRTVMKAGVWLV